MSAGGGVSRRDFLASLGASGLLVLFRADGLLAQEPGRLPARQGYPSDFNAYLHVGADGRTTCFVGKIEMGQGAMTALAQLVADELDVPFESVDMVMGDTDRCPWDMGTFGSLTIRQFGPVLRGAAAEARAAILELASERLGVPAAQLQTRDGVVSRTGDAAARVTYGGLVQGKRIERHVADIKVKEPAALRVAGRPAPRKDAREKVTGRAKYAADIGLPGVLHARLVRPPAHGARLRGVDTSAAEAIDGVRVVRDGELIAVLHERPDVAAQALARVRAEFDHPAATVDDATIFDHLVTTAGEPQVLDASGDLAAGEKLARSVFERTYLNAYVAHAALETHSAVARFADGRVTVWASTQTPFGLKSQVAQALGLEAERVRVITPYLGGGFGGKSASRQAVEAARLARLVGRPVQVVFDRAEEFFFDTFRPAAVVKLRSGLDAAGRIAFWDFKVYCAGEREATSFYEVPHRRTASAGGWMGQQPPGLHPFAVGPWRAPSVNTNTFARESQIDVMAAAAGADPLAFRLAHLGNPRIVKVLRAAAQRFGWAPKPAPSGRGFGIACAAYLGTFVAACAEVAVDRASGNVRVERVVLAQDMGLVVNPDGARQQIEGSVTMGLGYALSEEVRFAGGEVLDRNFDTYRLPRFSWVPKIDSVLVGDPAAPPSGGGEPPIVCMGAVIANAIHDACGARLLHLPMTPARVKAALAHS
ncbi:MAG TPA: molybdopterin cofactor-binding domain-containing protein [Thermoanaerobaculaceae bacterium]|nr:molybdopterin cofactor-binding domain-containing protein [Thermoanaerobaculaceae bacterium]